MPKLKSLDSTVAEISRGFQNFGGNPLAQTLAKLDPKFCFWPPTSETQVVCQISY